MLFRPVGLQPLPTLQAWLPNLLRREVELSLEKLGLLWDHTYAWDMFLDMMVGGFCARAAILPEGQTISKVSWPRDLFFAL